MMGFNLLREAPQGFSEVPSSASVSGLYWEEGLQSGGSAVGTEVEGVHSLGPEVSPFNPPRGVLQCRPPRALHCAQSLGRGPCDPAPLSEHAHPQFPQDLSFPLLLTPGIPVLLWERSAETRSGGGAKPEGTVASVRPSIRPSVCLSVCGKKQVKPRRQSDGIGQELQHSPWTGLRGPQGRGGPCWRCCRTSWGHRGTATAVSHARWRLSTAERAPRAGGAGGRRRGLAWFAGQRFQPCPPLPCAFGVGRGGPYPLGTGQRDPALDAGLSNLQVGAEAGVALDLDWLC